MVNIMQPMNGAFAQTNRISTYINEPHDNQITEWINIQYLKTSTKCHLTFNEATWSYILAKIEEINREKEKLDFPDIVTINKFIYDNGHFIYKTDYREVTSPWPYMADKQKYYKMIWKRDKIVCKIIREMDKKRGKDRLIVRLDNGSLFVCHMKHIRANKAKYLSIAYRLKDCIWGRQAVTSKSAEAPHGTYSPEDYLIIQLSAVS